MFVGITFVSSLISMLLYLLRQSVKKSFSAHCRVRIWQLFHDWTLCKSIILYFRAKEVGQIFNQSSSFFHLFVFSFLLLFYPSIIQFFVIFKFLYQATLVLLVSRTYIFADQSFSCLSLFLVRSVSVSYRFPLTVFSQLGCLSLLLSLSLSFSLSFQKQLIFPHSECYFYAISIMQSLSFSPNRFSIDCMSVLISAALQSIAKIFRFSTITKIV